MSGKRTKLLRKEALETGVDIYTTQIAGRGRPNAFRKIKEYYNKHKTFPA